MSRLGFKTLSTLVISLLGLVWLRARASAADRFHISPLYRTAYLSVISAAVTIM